MQANNCNLASKSNIIIFWLFVLLFIKQKIQGYTNNYILALKKQTSNMVEPWVMSVFLQLTLATTVKNVALMTFCPLCLLTDVRSISDPHVFSFLGQNYNNDNSGDNSSTLLPERRFWGLANRHQWNGGFVCLKNESTTFTMSCLWLYCFERSSGCGRWIKRGSTLN